MSRSNTLLLAAVVVSFSVPPAAAAFTPSQEGLLLWLDASDSATLELDGDAVAVWKNKSLIVHASAKGAAGARPRLISGGGRPTVAFDGVDDVLRISDFNERADSWTLVTVLAPYCPVKGGGICSAVPRGGHDYDPGFTVDLSQAADTFDQVSIEGAGRIGGQQDQMASAFACGGAHVLVVVRAPETVRLFIDGRLEGERPVTRVMTVMDELRIGARCYAGQERNYYHGEIAQVLLYGRAIADGERAALEAAWQVSAAEQKRGEAEAVARVARERDERQKDRMKAPQAVKVWPNVEAFAAEQAPALDLRALPVRTDMQEALALCVRHLNSLYDRDRDNEPYFYANCMADGTGKLRHSVSIGIPHVVGRCFVGCRMAEKLAGVPFPAEGRAILERYCRSSFDNPDHLNSYFDPEKNNARFVEFHNMREGLYALWALADGADSAWAREEAHRMLETLDRLTDAEGRWSMDLAAVHGMKERCQGMCIPNAARLVDPLLAYYDLAGDPLAMKLAGLYARQGLNTMYTPEGRFAPMDRSSGHVHSITSTLSGITAYAIRTNDRAMLEACRRIVDVGVPEYFSSWGWGDEVFPEHPADAISRGEINQTGDVVRTALLLGDAGYPRYYELAERFVRSMLLPTQHREPELRKFLRDKPEPVDDSERDVVSRSAGGYAMQLPNDRMRAGDWPVTTLDITSGAAHALSEFWAHRVSVRDGAYDVNLLFNFEDDRLAIESGLPFAGRLAFRAKAAIPMLRVFIPPWVDAATVRVSAGGEPRPAAVEGSFVNVGALEAGAAAEVTFSVPCKVERETVDGIEYTTTWAGNQIIAITPRGEVSPLPF